jgi:hypothetical protein
MNIMYITNTDCSEGECAIIRAQYFQSISPSLEGEQIITHIRSDLPSLLAP